jgi:hypothetical protein
VSPSLDFDSIVAEARERAGGLSNFGDPSWEEAARRLLASLEQEAKLHEVGRATMRERVVQMLENRLRAEEHFARHPEIADEEIVRLFAIVGLARTGTTMLHRTIASDPRVFALLWWESRAPAPLLEPFEGTDPRILKAEAEIAAMIEAVPDLMASHPFDAHSPDEEIMLMEHSFYSTNTEAFVAVPSYSRWLDEQDQTPGYAYLKRLLQLLQWEKKRNGAAAERWVLKTPHHLGFMQYLFATFPDAQVIQTHRDPVETIPSFASLCHNVRMTNSDEVDPLVSAADWGGRMQRALPRCMDFRKTHDDRFIDVWYDDLLREPLVEIQRIYEFVDLEFTPEAKAAMERWQIENQRDKRPSHDYHLEDFGLTEQGIRHDFARYRNHFIERGLERGRS